MVLGVIGDPVAHSLSPRMMASAMRHAGIEGTMHAFRVPAARLSDALAGVRGLGLRGLSVTLPHKEAVVALCDALDATARTPGAVNCVVNDGGRIVGYNTDVGGLSDALRELGVGLSGAQAVVLGAGGAARGVVAALLAEGVERIDVANRDFARAEALARSFAPARLGAHALDAEGLDPKLGDCDLLINATILGMDGLSAPPVDVKRLGPRAVVLDVVYAPGGTPLCRAARARGLVAADGLSMLVHQGLRALEIWAARSFDRSALSARVRADLEGT